MSPLPEDVHPPCGWVCKRACENELVFSHEKGGLEVAATKIDELQSLPYDLMGGWEVTCRRRARESESTRSVGRVTTRAAALDALRSCMERVTVLARTGSTDEITLATIAESAQLRGEIPPTARNGPARGGSRLRLYH